MCVYVSEASNMFSKFLVMRVHFWMNRAERCIEYQRSKVAPVQHSGAWFPWNLTGNWRTMYGLLMQNTDAVGSLTVLRAFPVWNRSAPEMNDFTSPHSATTHITCSNFHQVEGSALYPPYLRLPKSQHEGDWTTVCVPQCDLRAVGKTTTSHCLKVMDIARPDAFGFSQSILGTSLSQLVQWDIGSNPSLPSFAVLSWEIGLIMCVEGWRWCGHAHHSLPVLLIIHNYSTIILTVSIINLEWLLTVDELTISHKLAIMIRLQALSAIT